MLEVVKLLVPQRVESKVPVDVVVVPLRYPWAKYSQLQSQPFCQRAEGKTSQGMNILSIKMACTDAVF